MKAKEKKRMRDFIIIYSIKEERKENFAKGVSSTFLKSRKNFQAA